jgi:uncharacterized iron-regulated membrane protein
MGLRRGLAAVHRWTTLLCGALFVIVTLSGALTVFQYEVDAIAHPDLYRATPGDVGFERAAQATHAASGTRSIRLLLAPSAHRAQGVYRASLRGLPAVQVHVDPGTGAVLGTRVASDDSWIRWIHLLHVNLALSDSALGLAVVGVIGLVLLVSLGTGAIVWWPGARRWTSGFRVRAGRGSTLLLWDIHRVLGIVAVPALITIVAAGVGLAFDEPTNRVMHAAVRQEPYVEPDWPALEAQALRAAQTPEAPWTLDRVVEEAGRVAGGEAVSIAFPSSRERAVLVSLRRPGDPLPEGSSKVLIDRANGIVLGSVLPEQLSATTNLARSWRFALHAGSFGGVGVKALYVAAGIVPSVSFATGLVTWSRKLAARRAQAAGRATLRNAERP